jgi:hypothetical protein
MGLLTQQPADATIRSQSIEDLVSLEMAWCGFVRRTAEVQDIESDGKPEVDWANLIAHIFPMRFYRCA